MSLVFYLSLQYLSGLINFVAHNFFHVFQVCEIELSLPHLCIQLSASRLRFVRAYIHEKQEASFLDGFVHAFEFFGGVPTEGLFDNLKTAVQKILQGRDRIYIDPPFNTSGDSFIYNDRFNHSTWLTFMKNRLEIAKELLATDGTIYIHLDYNEVHYLKVLMDEILLFLLMKKYGRNIGKRIMIKSPI